ncbi:MAG: glycoside hydrolase, partial [Methylophilaceae bacterium]|nr:glycoside hydrolase [Methylophilaceae bacterium]
MRIRPLIHACLLASLSGLVQANEAAPVESPGLFQQAGSAVQDILLFALSLSGTPYKFGGHSPETGFDC